MGAETYPLYLIPLLPLIGAAFNLILGRYLPRRVVHFAAVGAVAAACGVSLWLVGGPLWDAFKAWKESGEGAAVPQLSQVAYTWIEVGNFKAELAFRLDTLSAVMILIVTFVGTLIHIYSTGYMSHEPRYAAYFGYLNLFTGAMLILVLAANLPVMFIGWEGVGVCSYLLIGFWFTNPAYADAGRKAFVVNRIGDFAFLLGMFLLFWAVKDDGFARSLDFFDLRSPGAQESYLASFWGGERISTWICLLLFIGACGKSAQIPLYVWLPDAMAGPTPVSALIHAATMVTAGVYMIARLSFLYMTSTTAMAVVCGIGALTAVVAAFMAFAQTDLKKVLAYSTVSQLGFMFVGVGSGAFVAGIFHLMTHAFFKAGLFLGAGSVMHAMSGSGDITKMGGLRKYLPLTHGTFIIYCLAIAGIFPFAGFFSKDEILAGIFTAHAAGWPGWYGTLIWILLSAAALGTSFYMFRLYFLVFAGELRADEETRSHIHESPTSMTLPLVILAVGAIFLGFLGLPHLESIHLPTVLHSWLEPSLRLGVIEQEIGGQMLQEGVGGHGSDAKILGLMGAALALGALGIFLAWRLYGRGPSRWVAEKTADGAGNGLYRASLNKLWVDEFYETTILGPFRWLARGSFEFVDRFVIDTIFVNGSAFVVNVISRVVRRIQNGQVQRYMVGVILGAAAIFFLTSSPALDFHYQQVGPDTVRFQADTGAGPAGVGAGVRWDFDGDGNPDTLPAVRSKVETIDADVAEMHRTILKAAKAVQDERDPVEKKAKQAAYDKVEHALEPQIENRHKQRQALEKNLYVTGDVIEKRTGEIGDQVTLWVTDGVFKKTRSVTHRIQLLPFQAKVETPAAAPIGGAP
jgi:NADH-quinone oxidoreductase subunit L